jgi:ferredoxin
MMEAVNMYKVDDSHCIGCGVCVDVCPEGAIHLTDEDVALIDQEMCVGCGACAEICPQETIEKLDEE